MKNIKRITSNLIAPCGINCAACRAHLRDKNPCHGCRDAEQNKPKTRTNCKIRLCQKRKTSYCSSCNDFPCERLETLDKRYRQKYDYSEIVNLRLVKDEGINKLIEKESNDRLSQKGILCIHDHKYYK
jgi:hypothetical protein